MNLIKPLAIFLFAFSAITRYRKKIVLLGLCSAALSSGAITSASAAGIERVYGENAAAPIAAGVSVPAGYTTYYISGALPRPITPAANGQPADYGDMATQPRSAKKP